MVVPRDQIYPGLTSPRAGRPVCAAHRTHGREAHADLQHEANLAGNVNDSWVPAWPVKNFHRNPSQTRRRHRCQSCETLVTTLIVGEAGGICKWCRQNRLSQARFQCPRVVVRAGCRARHPLEHRHRLEERLCPSGARLPCRQDGQHPPRQARPSRKINIADSELLAQPGSCNLFCGSSIPPKDPLEPRLAAHQRERVGDQLIAKPNRPHKRLDDAGTRLGSLVADINGKAAKAVVDGLIDGLPPETAIRLTGRLKGPTDILLARRRAVAALHPVADGTAWPFPLTQSFEALRALVRNPNSQNTGLVSRHPPFPRRDGLLAPKHQWLSR